VSKLRKTWTILIVAFGLLAATGVASAQDGDVEEPVDDNPAVETTVNFAYDAENHIFMVNAWTSDAGYDCKILADSLMVGYGATEDGSLTITPEVDGELDGECVLSGGVVGGPNGQINHGQFMKLFHQIVGKKGNGCLNRMIAQSDLGKGDDQIRTSEVDKDFEAGESGPVEFETFTADCAHGPKDKDEDHPSKGNKDKAKKDDDGAPGNSGNARGNKK
jgi:hypothetical protein